MNLNKRVESILNSTPAKRIDFTVSRFCDSGEIWALQSKKDNGFIKYIDENNKILFPIFPEIEIAELYKKEEWKDTEPVEFEVDYFFYELIPFLIENKITLSVFPNFNFTERNLLSPQDFARKIQKVLKDDYDEIYELDYL